MKQLECFVLDRVGKLCMFPDSLYRYRAVDIAVQNARTGKEIQLPVLTSPTANGRFVSDRVSFNAIDSLQILMGEKVENSVGRIAVPNHLYREADIKRGANGYLGLLPDIREATGEDFRRVIPVAVNEYGTSRISDRMTYILTGEHTELYSSVLENISDEMWIELNRKNQSYIGWDELCSSIKRGVVVLPFKFDHSLLTPAEFIPQEILDAFSLYRSINR